jgi:large subunit ribosomal protein L5
MAKSLQLKYQEEFAPGLAKEFGVKNKMAIPRVEKVIVNMGIGEESGDKGKRQGAMQDMAAITGQRPSIRQAKISVAGFGLRKGMPVGLKVTLRGKRMYDFLERLFNIVLPRFRDFRGLSLDSFDQAGNYTLGIEEHSVFPEIDISKTKPRGLEVTIVTNTKDREKAEGLLKALGMPFEKEE